MGNERMRGISEASVQTTESFILDEEVDEIMRGLQDYTNTCYDNYSFKIKEESKDHEEENKENEITSKSSTNKENNGDTEANKRDFNNNNNKESNGNNAFLVQIEEETKEEGKGGECLKLYDDENIIYFKDGEIKKLVEEKREQVEAARKEYSFYNNNYRNDQRELKVDRRNWKYMTYVLVVLILILSVIALWELSQIQEIKSRISLIQSSASDDNVRRDVPETSKLIGHRRTPPVSCPCLYLLIDSFIKNTHQCLNDSLWKI